MFWARAALGRDARSKTAPLGGNKADFPRPHTRGNTTWPQDFSQSSPSLPGDARKAQHQLGGNISGRGKAKSHALGSALRNLKPVQRTPLPSETSGKPVPGLPVAAADPTPGAQHPELGLWSSLLGGSHPAAPPQGPLPALAARGMRTNRCPAARGDAAAGAIMTCHPAPPRRWGSSNSLPGPPRLAP